MTAEKWPHFDSQPTNTHIIKGFGPGSDLPSTVQASEQGVAQYVDSHRQRVNRGAVEGDAVSETLFIERKENIKPHPVLAGEMNPSIYKHKAPSFSTQIKLIWTIKTLLNVDIKYSV